MAPLAAVESGHLDWPSDLGWVHFPSSTAIATGSESENDSFHYLIRIAECALTLHCEVKTDNATSARHRVEQIPNLLEWRHISCREVAEILKMERTVATQLSAGSRGYPLVDASHAKPIEAPMG
jgi:hypothetical protein